MPPLRVILCSAFLSIVMAFASHAETADSEASLLQQLRSLESDGSIADLDKLALNEQLHQLATQQQWRAAELATSAYQAILYAISDDFEQAESSIEAYRSSDQTLQDNRGQRHVVAAALYIAASRGDNAEFTRLKLELTALIEAAIISGDSASIADSLLNLGSSLLLIERYEESIEALTEAINLFEQQQRFYGLNEAINALAIVYDEQEDHEGALALYLAVLAEKRVELNVTTRSTVLYNIGHTYGELEQHQQAIDYLRKSRVLSEQIDDDTGVSYADLVMIRSLLELEQYQQALAQIEQASIIITKQYSISLFLQLNADKIRALIGIKQFEQARALLAELQETYTERSDEDEQQFYLLSYQLEDAQQRYDEALIAYKSYADLKIKNANKSRERSMQGLLEEFGVEQTHAENRLLEQTNQLKQAQLDQAEHEVVILYLFGGCAAALCCAILLFWSRERASRRKVQQAALQDFLTGAPNRRAVIEYAGKTLSGCVRKQAPFCLAVIDLDYFKQFNDRYGHDIGDKVLQAFANVCRQELRSEDQFGRFGGEEWLLVFPNTSIDKLPALFTRLQNAYSAVKIDGVDIDLAFTFSMGAAQWHDNFADLDALIKAADDNVYLAKAKGRNQLAITERTDAESPLQQKEAQQQA